MALTLSEIKELIAFGQEIGLQQLQTEGLVAVYGPNTGATPPPNAGEPQDDTLSILSHYSAIGRSSLKGHSGR